MNIPSEGSRLDLQFEAIIQEINETMQAVIGRLVAAIDQRIFTIDDLDLRIILLEQGQVRIMIPQFRARSSDVRDELARITLVQVSHRSGEHHDVARRKMIS